MTDILLQIGATKLVLAVALAGMVWLVTRRVARPAIAHPLWLLVLGAMLVPAVVPLRILPEEAEEEVVAQPAVVAQPEAAPLRVPPEEVAAEAEAGEATQSEGGPPAAVAEAGVSGDGMAPRGWLPLRGKPLAVLLWLLGSGGFFGWTVVRTVRFQRTLTRAARPAPQLQRLAAEIGEALGLSRVPPVYTTGARVRPLVWWAGGRVRVVIPSMFLADLDETELRAVLAHELAHVRRRDYLVRVVELLACSAYWWNPVVWWVRRRMRSAEESSCDILAVSASRLTRDRYARSLLRVVEVMSAVPIPRAPALASAAEACRDSKLLEKRLRTVLATALPVSHTTGRLRVAGAAALAFGLSLGLVYCAPGERMAFDQPQLATPARSEDSAGIRFSEYFGLPDTPAPFALATDPRFRHGNSPGDFRFCQVYAGALLADGRAVVADAHNNELMVLSPDGTMLASKGGRLVDLSPNGTMPGSKGGEPVDLGNSITAFPLGQDSVLVADPSRGYLTLFVDGSVDRSVDAWFKKGLDVWGLGSHGFLLLAAAVSWSGLEDGWLPGHQRPVGDSEGRIWLSTSMPGGPQEGSPSFAVISLDGEWLGTVEAPVGFRILDVAGGQVLGVQTDEARRESVVVYVLIEQ